MKQKKKLDKRVYRSLTLISQFGINMIVPIGLMLWLGMVLDERLGTSYLVVLFFFGGAIAGFQNIYRMAKKISQCRLEPEEHRPKQQNGGDGRMLERGKQRNRGLLELNIGILFWGILCQIIGVFLAKEPILYSIALWIGILMALFTTYHMYRTLDKALEQGTDAVKSVAAGNVLRYLCIILIFGGIVWSGKLNPLITFLGLITLKPAAYLQPFVHKVCNRIFQEERSYTRG